MTFLPILSTVMWILSECSHKKLELTPAEPLVKGSKHLCEDETQKSKNSETKPTEMKKSLEPFKNSIPTDESEPKPKAASLKCGRTQASKTVPVNFYYLFTY
ncbi:unnamed protein product [Onchocerca ochengi]|uniref:LYVE1 n=1 Tax=Onchocerca ochengi TaxID=42157 RepID=A0A182ELP2_ONCOC|nr:unnamed protein product [Onchocerca ochengi]